MNCRNWLKLRTFWICSWIKQQLEIVFFFTLDIFLASSFYFFISFFLLLNKTICSSSFHRYLFQFVCCCYFHSFFCLFTEIRLIVFNNSREKKTLSSFRMEQMDRRFELKRECSDFCFVCFCFIFCLLIVQIITYSSSTHDKWVNKKQWPLTAFSAQVCWRESVSVSVLISCGDR